jgi:hypothetical protein
MSSTALDSYPDCPLYYVHVDASQRRIIEDVEALVRQWKERRNIPERRTRITHFDDYLRIWDLREGWQDGSYEAAAERSFGQVARELGLPKSSVVNGYRAAFERIVGQRFSPELWIRVMGLVKLTWLQARPEAVLTARYRRLLSSNKPKPAPESRIERAPTERGDVGLVERETAIESEQELVELMLDAVELKGRGLSDDAIIEKLELLDPARARYLLELLAEMGSTD